MIRFIDILLEYSSSKLILNRNVMFYHTTTNQKHNFFITDNRLNTKIRLFCHSYRLATIIAVEPKTECLWTNLCLKRLSHYFRIQREHFVRLHFRYQNNFYSLKNHTNVTTTRVNRRKKMRNEKQSGYDERCSRTENT